MGAAVGVRGLRLRPVRRLGRGGRGELLALLGALLYSLRACATRSVASAVTWLAALVAAAVLVGAAFALPSPDTSGERTVTVATVQGNVPGDGMDALGEARPSPATTWPRPSSWAWDVASGSKPCPELVIWPENSTDIDLFRDVETRVDIEAAVKAVGVPILVGAVLDGPGPNERQTTGGVGPGKRAWAGLREARHLVPFGEYILFREQLLPYIKRLEMVGRQTAPGTVPGVLRIGDVLYGDVICSEIAYDDVMDDVMDGGAQILVVQTNNATYGGTGQPDQQFGITWLRAVETGRDVLVASTNGISGVIHPDGAVEHKSGQGVADVYVTEVPVRTAKTLATVLGPWPQWILADSACSAPYWRWCTAVAGGRTTPRRLREAVGFDSRDLQAAGAGAEKRRESET